MDLHVKTGGRKVKVCGVRVTDVPAVLGSGGSYRKRETEGWRKRTDYL